MDGAWVSGMTYLLRPCQPHSRSVTEKASLCLISFIIIPFNNKMQQCDIKLFILVIFHIDFYNWQHHYTVVIGKLN